MTLDGVALIGNIGICVEDDNYRNHDDDESPDAQNWDETHDNAQQASNDE